MLVCIDKVTCARMLQRIVPLWEFKLSEVRATIPRVEAELRGTAAEDERERLTEELDQLRGQAQWMDSTIIELIISEAQNEGRDFAKWGGFDIVPHRVIMKTGFETPDGKRVAVDDAFKDPEHPFRVAIVCAMWLTGFDVECLSTLYVDKPMKAHTLMQAIARTNRVYPGKDCGVIVDYNGMLKSLRAALAQYALGDDDGGGGEDIIAPIEELVAALLQAIEATEKHLLDLGFDASRLAGATGFARIEALHDGVDALYTSDEAKRRFEIMARQVFNRFKALLTEPSVFAYVERRDNIEAIYKKLQEKRDIADVTDLLKELHKIVNEAIRAQAPGEDHANSLQVDLSRIDFTKLREEFATRVTRKRIALQDIRDVIETKLARMLARNPMRMDYYRKYHEIIADYNREKDRVTIEDTFALLCDLIEAMDVEERRAAQEGLSETELALFDLLGAETISKTDRERVKLASKTLLASLRELLRPMADWMRNTATQAEVQVFILDALYVSLPRPPFTDEATEDAARRVYEYVWDRSASGGDLLAA
jgi:type I restriction enzyme R subunit